MGDAADAGINAAGVFAHHDKVHVLGFFALQGAIFGAVEFDRAQIDVLVQREAGFQQDADFQDAGFDIRVADGAQIEGGVLAEFVQRGIGERFAGFQVALGAEVVGGVVQFEAEFLRAASITLTASRVTSGPVPSPGINPME